MTDCQTPCRITGVKDLVPVLSPGHTPLADVLLTEDELTGPAQLYPLTLAFSPSSALVQLVETVPREIIFNDRCPYFSSVSSTLATHFKKSAESIIESQRLGPASLVIEAASSDGCLPRHFVKHDISALGIDPSGGPARTARKIGVPTVVDFLTCDPADALVKQYGQADVFIANNVLAHVADLNDFMAGIARVLHHDGIAVFKFPYVFGFDRAV